MPPRLACALCLLALAGQAAAVTFPTVGTQMVAYLASSKVPNNMRLAKAPAGSYANVIFTYDGNARWLGEVALAKVTQGLKPSSLNVWWRKSGRGATANFVQLFTVVTDFVGGDDIIPVLYADIQGALAYFSATAPEPRNLGTDDRLYFVLNTANGSLAGQFTDKVERRLEVPPSTASVYTADVTGNATFFFGSRPETQGGLAWPEFTSPLATRTARFRINVTAANATAWRYRVRLSAPIKDSSSAISLSLFFRNGTTSVVPCLSLPINATQAFTAAGYTSTFTAAALRQGLTSKGRTGVTEVYPLLKLSASTGMAAHFTPPWRVDPTP